MLLGMKYPIVADAINAAGGAKAVASELGLSEWGVQKWGHVGLPAKHVLWLAERTDWQYTPHLLDRDLYPHAEDGLPEAMRKKRARAVLAEGRA
jgi:hypothetical protein